MNQTLTTAPASTLQTALLAAGRVRARLESASPLLDLCIRVYMANVFFKAGLVKIGNWDTTLALFRDEYKVPLLPTDLAAVLGTGGELVLPVLLALGLFGRFGALGLFVMNIVAVVSYPDIGEAAKQEHFYWGVLLLVALVKGPGKWSFDAWLWPNVQKR